MFTCVTYEFYSKLGCVYFFTNNNFAQTTVFDFFLATEVTTAAVVVFSRSQSVK